MDDTFLTFPSEVRDLLLSFFTQYRISLWLIFLLKQSPKRHEKALKRILKSCFLRYFDAWQRKVGQLVGSLLAQKFWAGLHWPAHNFSHIIAQKQVHEKSLYSDCVNICSLIFLWWTLKTPIYHPDVKKWSKLNILWGFFEVQNC